MEVFNPTVSITVSVPNMKPQFSCHTGRRIDIDRQNQGTLVAQKKETSAIYCAAVKLFCVDLHRENRNDLFMSDGVLLFIHVNKQESVDQNKKVA